MGDIYFEGFYSTRNRQDLKAGFRERQGKAYYKPRIERIAFDLSKRLEHPSAKNATDRKPLQV